MSGRSDRCFGTPVGATTLLLVIRHSCWCFGTPVDATALLLVLRHSCWCLGTPVGATTLLLVLRHSCCVGSHVLIGGSALLLCGKTCPYRCFGTPAGATTLLLRGQACPDRCFDISALCYGTSVLYSIFGYLLCCILLISYDWSG